MADELTADEIRVLKAIAQGVLALEKKSGGASASAKPSSTARASGGAPSAEKAPSPQKAPAGEAAADADLDGQYGDPTIKFDPKRWSGRSYVGSTYSQTEPAYLDAVAEALEWSANNPRPGKEKYASYDRRDAARARGWAARLRKSGPRTEGAPPAGPQEPLLPDYESPPGDDDIPF
jgi:hypothetical protein